jgi:hypothetical protein
VRWYAPDNRKEGVPNKKVEPAYFLNSNAQQ